MAFPRAKLTLWYVCEPNNTCTQPHSTITTKMLVDANNNCALYQTGGQHEGRVNDIVCSGPETAFSCSVDATIIQWDLNALTKAK